MARTLSSDHCALDQVGHLQDTARKRADGCRMLHMPDPQGAQEGISISALAMQQLSSHPAKAVVDSISDDLAHSHSDLH
jgi:hypothetical protein